MVWLVSKRAPHRPTIRPGDVTVAVALAREVHDLLDAGDVGLYEFIWILRGLNRWMAPGRRVSCARLALEGLLSSAGVRLVLKRWPESKVIDVLTLATLPADAWREPGPDGLYVAVDRLHEPVALNLQLAGASTARLGRARRRRLWADLLPQAVSP